MGSIVISGFGGTQVTLNSNATQDAALTRMVANANVVIAAQQPPGTPLTIETFIQKVIVDDFTDKIAQVRRMLAIDAKTAWDALTAGQRNTAKTTYFGGVGNDPFGG